MDAVHPSHWARSQPEAPAIIMAGSGETVSFRQLEDASNQGAHVLRSLGLQRGDTFALFSDNSPRFVEAAGAMLRAGLYMVPIQSKLLAGEAAYIVNDSGARVLLIDAQTKHGAELATGLKTLCPGIEHAFAMNGPLAGLPSWEAACAAMPAMLIADPSMGAAMIYSSGTTGKPKGIHRDLSDAPWDAPNAFGQLMAHRYGTRAGMKFVLSAPLYHSGSFAMMGSVLALGATLLLFEKFDPETMLAAIDRHRPDQGQFVPTMFIRMLKLPGDVRARYDCSSLRLAVHSAGPCSIETKRAMIDWWGPILDEIYGGTENVGSTMIDSHEWLRKPGSVGRPLVGTLHICDDAGNELPVGETGVIYFNSGAKFTYLNDAAKTRDVHNPKHPDWGTFGDIGRIDEDGYLYLADRKSFMIITGGVNIYPQEIEDALSLHPAVADVAVFGVPHPELDEVVKAVVQPAADVAAGAELEAQLIAYCKTRLATLKCPRSIDFEAELPRDPTGKLAKRTLKARYWPAA